MNPSVFIRPGSLIRIRAPARRTLDDHREAVTTLEETVRIARRVLGSAHPITTSVECDLQKVRAALRARETPTSGGSEVLQTADDLAAYFGGA